MGKKSYSAHIRKADHPNKDGSFDLHAHVNYNEGKRRKLIGRYRLPGLEPVSPKKEPELTAREQAFIKDWLGQDKQQKKLANFLKETLFDMHKIKPLIQEYGEIETDEKGDTFITVRIPVSKRIE